MKLITIVGARPQFVKAAMVSRAIHYYNRQHPDQPIEEALLHTGQHYDVNMSQIFFQEMAIPMPTWQLHCGNTSHGAMTGQMLIEMEPIFMQHQPDAVLVYGDTNSTLAGALTAAKLHIPVIHVEAGLRSFNREMPEELNRVLTDHLATLLCCPTEAAIRHLQHEGITDGVHAVGDVMYDAALLFGEIAQRQVDVLDRLHLKPDHFRLCTVHRAENTDHPERLRAILDALEQMASVDCPVVWPLHPRTRQCLIRYQWLERLQQLPGLCLCAPMSFLEMVQLEQSAATILTDSGGVQKEAYFHRTPCITLRDETEWVETVAAGWNQLAGADTARILSCLTHQPVKQEISEYGTGHAADRIVELVAQSIG